MRAFACPFANFGRPAFLAFGWLKVFELLHERADDDGLLVEAEYVGHMIKCITTMRGRQVFL